jgi:YD repeat-containing protein
VTSSLGNVETFRNNKNPTTAIVDAFLAPLKTSLPDAHIAIYKYYPLSGLLSTTDPKGMTTYYEYDSFQRLMNIKDQDLNIIKNFDYHYKP